MREMPVGREMQIVAQHPVRVIGKPHALLARVGQNVHDHIALQPLLAVEMALQILLGLALVDIIGNNSAPLCGNEQLVGVVEERLNVCDMRVVNLLNYAHLGEVIIDVNSVNAAL